MTNRFLISVADGGPDRRNWLCECAGVAGPRRRVGRFRGAAERASFWRCLVGRRNAARHGGTVRHEGRRDRHTKGAEPSTKASESTDKMAPSKSAQDSNRMQGEKSKSMHSETNSTKGGKDMKAEGRDSKTGTTTTESRDSKSGDMNAQTKGATDSKSGTAATDTKSSTTTGNAATSATAAPPAEKRTQIVSAIRSEKIQETTNVNFNISVGAAVPASVHFHPLPPRIVEIYPEWRGYEVILVHGRYVIVRPQTREIVYIIEG